MALWLVRAGKYGEHEKKFLEDSRIYLTWDGLNHDLGKLKEREELINILKDVYPDAPKGRITNNGAQIWAFSQSMQKGDWFVMPSKLKSAIHIGEIDGPYEYDGKAEDPYYHSRKVKWIAEDIPRTNFDQDLLYSFGAFLTVCQITRNSAEIRVRAMPKQGWKTTPYLGPQDASGSDTNDETDTGLDENADFEERARDQIAKYILAKFKGHKMERLVEAILQAQGYTTYRTPKGSDHGIDIVAGLGAMGFGKPRICVQVKSESEPMDRPTLDQLIGTMQNVNADHGLIVSWSGFKNTVDKEKAIQFFRVRLWDQTDLMEQLFANYDKIDEDIRTDIPLKRVWALAGLDE